MERDIAAAAIPALLGDEHIGVRYALTGPQSLTQAEQVQVIGAAIGRDLVVAELPPEEFRQAPPAHLPPPAVDDMLQYLADHVGHGEPPTDLTTITGQPGTAFAVWAESTPAASADRLGNNSPGCRGSRSRIRGSGSRINFRKWVRRVCTLSYLLMSPSSYCRSR